MKIRDAVKRTIASNIKRARLDANMTQAEAADKLGITAQAVSNFERGINGIDNSMLLHMCEIYNTSMSYVLGEEEKENSPDEFVLTEGEKKLIQLLRKFPTDRQEFAVGMVLSALENMPGKEK